MFSIVLKIVNVGSKILFHNSVKAFRLFVDLWMIECRELGLDSKNDVKSLSELSDELRTLIEDYGSGEAM